MSGDWIEVLRKECREDFFFFIKTVLKPVAGVPGKNKFELSGAKHFKAMECLWNADMEGFYKLGLSQFGTLKLSKNKRHNKRVHLLPRIHGKTQVGTVAWLMWRLFKDPDLRILLMSQTWDNARAMLTLIKNYYIAIRETRLNPLNATPYWVLGDCVGNLWNEDQILLKTRKTPDKTPSILTAGIEKEITSQHFDIVKADDLIGSQNTQTLGQIEKTKRAIYALTEVGDYFLEIHTEYDFNGTIWHYNDWYAADVLRKLKDFYDVLIMRCWDKEDHIPLFPEKYTTQSLEDIKKEKLTGDNPLEWNCQWLNEPADEGTAIFKQGMLQYYDFKELPKHMTIGIFVDPALSAEKWSCYTAIVPIGIDKYGRRYVLPYQRIKEKDPDEIAKAIARMAVQYYKSGMEEGLAYVGVEEGREYNAMENKLRAYQWLPLGKLKIQGRSQDGRIFSLQPLLMNKQLFIHRSMVELKEQFLTFPRMAERDILDAVAYHMDIFPMWDKEPPEKQERFMDFSQRMWASVRRADNLRR